MRHATIVIFVCTFLSGCLSLHKPHDSSVASNPTVKPIDQQGLINAVAELKAEVAGIKAGRDNYTGLTFQGEMSVMLAVLLAIVVLSQTIEQLFDRWCEYRVEMRRP